MGGLTRSLCSNYQNFQGDWGTQSSSPGEGLCPPFWGISLHVRATHAQIRQCESANSAKRCLLNSAWKGLGRDVTRVARLRSLDFNPESLLVASGIDKVALKQVLLRGSFGSPMSAIIPPLLHTHLSPSCKTCESPDRQHSITSSVFKLGASSLSRHLAHCKVRKLEKG
jgi:hypothetical protein